jgi:hypothetical protein
MKCIQAKGSFSLYLDGAVTGIQMRELAKHLEACSDCKQEYESLQHMQQVLATMGRRKAPADLALRLRVAISQEVARTREAYWAGLWVRIENSLNAFMFPAMAGLATAVVVFGVLMGFLALPLQAGNTDVPLAFNTAPQLEQSGFGTGLDSIHDDSLVIEAVVDSNGRVQDYRVLSSSKESKGLSPEVKNALIFTTFRPATSMGRPTSGRAVLSFSKINVKG